MGSGVRRIKGYARDKFDDLRPDPGTSNDFAPIAVVPLLRTRLPAPTEDDVGREGGTDLAEDLPTEDFALGRQAPPGVVEPALSFAAGFPQDLVLGAEVLDVLLLAPVTLGGVLARNGMARVPVETSRGQKRAAVPRAFSRGSVAEACRGGKRKKPLDQAERTPASYGT